MIPAATKVVIYVADVTHYKVVHVTDGTLFTVHAGPLLVSASLSQLSTVPKARWMTW